MVKWIVMLICAASLAACGSMRSTSSSGSGGQSLGSGGSGEPPIGLTTPGLYGNDVLAAPGP
ncbi:MAG TPA: hypothetical protein VIF82_15650 [Burkholderiaceae bacterium]